VTLAPPVEAVQQATYALLKTPLANAGIPLFDRVPPGAPYPRVELGEHHYVPYKAKGYDGWEGGLSVHIYSQYEGMREASDVLQKVLDAIGTADLTDPDGQWNLMNFGVDVEAFDDGPPDARVVHVVARQRLKCLPLG
jgi:hypothetical protein